MMNDFSSRCSIRIEESAIGSAIVAGDSNTVYVIHQTFEQRSKQPVESGEREIRSNPYKGLASFKEEDANRYFGREVQVDRLWRRFQDLFKQSTAPRVLPILGPSGCGKSSLARAGLIPELARRPLPEKEQLRVAVLVPGTHPVEALAGVLTKVVTNDPIPVKKAGEFEEILRTPSTEGTFDGLRRIAALIPHIQDSPLVILVDQFEEVYSLCKDIDARQSFIETLIEAASDSTGNVTVILTLRSDFLRETQKHPALNDVIGSDQSAFIPAMKPAELRRAIIKPARLTGYTLDESIVALLVKDTQGREGALPLLQFALTQIWEGIIVNKDPADSYWDMGGVGGALAGKAQEIYDKLDDLEQDIARRVFVGLIQLGEGARDTRRRVALNHLIARRDDPEKVKLVTQKFSSPGARLITLSSQDCNEIVEVTHETLFEHWQQLNSWLDSSRDDIRFKRRLEAASSRWSKQGKLEGLLWRSPDLDLLQTYQQRAYQDMSEIELLFYQVSNQAEQRRKRTRKSVISALIFGFCLTSLSTVVAIWNVRETNRSNIKVLVESSATSRASGKEFDALITALRAGKKYTNSRLSDAVLLNQIQELLFLLLSAPNREINRFEGHSGEVHSVDVSPDGHTIATASEDGTAKLWNYDGSLIATLQGHTDGLSEVRFSPDKQTIATASRDGTAKLWNYDGSLITTFSGHKESVTDIQFSFDGKIIGTSSFDNMAKLWSNNGDLISTLQGHKKSVSSVKFSPDSQTIATVSVDGTAKLWDPNGRIIKDFKFDGARIQDIAFSSDSANIAIANDDGTVVLWSPGNDQEKTFIGHNDRIESIHFSPDNTTVATTSYGVVKLWRNNGELITTVGDKESPEPSRIRDGRFIAPPQGHGIWFDEVLFVPNSNIFIKASYENTATLWRQSGILIDTLKGHKAPIQDIDFDSYGNTIATASKDGTVKLWERNAKLINHIQDRDSFIRSVGFSPDRKTIYTISDDGKAKLWDRDNFLRTSILEHESNVTQVRFSPNGEIIVSVSNNGVAKLWRQDGSLIKPLKSHAKPISDVAFSPDGEILATASQDKTAKIWHRNGNLISTLNGHDFAINSISFSMDGENVTTFSGDGTVKQWDLDGNLVNTIEDYSYSKILYSLDGKTIVYIDQRAATLWEIDTNILSELREYGSSMPIMSFDLANRSLFSLESNFIKEILEQNGNLITTFEGSNFPVADIRLSPDGKTFAVIEDNNNIEFWRRNDDIVLPLEMQSDNLIDVRFSWDGETLATINIDGDLSLWPWSLDSLMQYSCQQLRGYLKYSPHVAPNDRNLCD